MHLLEVWINMWWVSSFLEDTLEDMDKKLRQTLHVGTSNVSGEMKSRCIKYESHRV